MATTCKLIAKNVLGSSAASVTFSSIPGTYTDLYLVCTARTDRSAVNDGVKARFNAAGSDTNHSSRVLVGDGSAAYSFSQSFVRVGYASAATATSNTFGSSEMYVPNYAGSTNKSMSSTGVQETNASGADMGAAASLWSSTDAITQIEVLPLTGPNFVSGSSFFLYGITRSDDNTPGTFGIQATGGDVTISGGYKYHVFKSSGTFTVTEPGWADILVVAGGGGGGGSALGNGGGGGAGGFLSKNMILNANSYAIIVGSGGSGTTADGAGVSGSNSSLSTILSSTGGGGGAGRANTALAKTGGSGGGGSGGEETLSISTFGASGISGQGFSGGNGLHAFPNYPGGGGGGASIDGSNATSTVGGNGGAGKQWPSSSGPYYAGGGGGNTYNGGTAGSGGIGGGGNATANASINTGGGGGGFGGNGGSGIVIIRYPVS